MNSHNDENSVTKNDHKRMLDKHLDAIGWGLFLVMIGALMIMPKGIVHEDAWLIGMGVIIIAVNGIRNLYGIRIQGFWTVIGIVAIAFGLSGVYGLDLPVFQVILILFGISIILKPWKSFGRCDCFGMMKSVREENSVNQEK